jgi:hypothetical protein
VGEFFDLWLVALGDDFVPDGSEMRTYWRVKGDPTPVLDAALGRADWLYVGSWTSAHESEVPRGGGCPARRVFDWLFWRGTADGYGVPVLDDQLAQELLGCFGLRVGDLPAPAVDAGELRAFLIAHRGCGVLPEDHGPGR